MDPEEGSTPTAQWAASPSWWVGDDLRSDDGNRDEHLPLAAPARSSDIRRSSHLAAAASEEGAPHRPRDSRRMFGDLPNSSLDPDVLGDPIQRELERRAAGPDVIQREPAEATVAIGPRIVTFADSTRQPGAALSGNGTNSHGFWQIECSRLQGQIASLAREKERWESERRHLLAEDVERARELAGLRRAVEAQSQLVMESLVAAQRLAASGAAPVPTRGGPVAISGDVMETSWVQPRAAAMVGDTERGISGDRTYIERSPWGFPQESRGGTMPTRNRSGYGLAGMDMGMNFDRRYTDSSGNAAEFLWSPRQSPSTDIVAAAKAASGPNRDGVPQAFQPRRGSTADVSQAAASRRGSYDPVIVASGNSGEGPRPAAGASSGSTEMVPAPRAAALQLLPQAGAGRVQRPTATAQPRTSGWQRVASESSEVDGTESLDREVWEWNGRRVVLHVQPQRRPPAAANGPGGDEKAEGGQKEEARPDTQTEEEVRTLPTAATPTTRADEAAAASAVPAAAAVVPQSLLKDIEDIKAMVQTLATAAVGDRAAASLSSPETAAARRNQQSLQPRPPENAPTQRSGTSPPQTSSPTGRRVSLPGGSTAQQPIAPLQSGPNGAPISEGRDGGVGDQRRGVASDLPNGRNECFGDEIEKSSESGRAVSDGGQSDAGKSTRRGGEGAAPVAGHDSIPSSPRDGEGGEEKGRRARPSTGSGDRREGGPTDAEGGDGHDPARGAGPRLGSGERNDELAEINQPAPENGEDANCTNAGGEPPAASSAEGTSLGVEGEGEEHGDGQGWFLDEDPEKCFVG